MKRLPWKVLLATGAAFAALLGLIVAASTFVRLPSTPVPEQARALPRVLVASGAVEGATAAVESALLLGPTPLFLPTSVNGSQVDLPASARREPGASFPAFVAKLTHREEAFQVDLPVPFPVVPSPADGLGFGQTAGEWPYLGALPRVISSLPKRVAQVEVVASDGGKIIFQKEVPPLSKSAPEAEWRPLEMLLTVNAAGAVTDPVITQGSGVPEWDSALREHVVGQLALGVRLWPGFYRVRVGP